MGAPFGQPEWSALSLMEAPHLVQKAHESFARAGSDILTTSNYAVVPFHIGERRFLTEGPILTNLAGHLARQAAATTGCKVAGSIPPLFGSYRPDLFNPDKAPELLKIIVDTLSPHVDLWLGETVSSINEAIIVADAICGDARPLWVSFTLQDDEDAKNKAPCLRSGELVVNAVEAVINAGASAILFNCSQPEIMAPAVETAYQLISQRETSLQIGVYANAFPPAPKTAEANADLMEIREDLDPEGYLGYAKLWKKLGATIVGGCCGIGPEHIAALHRLFKQQIQ